MIRCSSFWKYSTALTKNQNNFSEEPLNYKKKAIFINVILEFHPASIIGVFSW